METASRAEPGGLFLEAELFFLPPPSLRRMDQVSGWASPVRGPCRLAWKVREVTRWGCGGWAPPGPPRFALSCLFLWGTWLCPHLPMSSSKSSTG